MKGNRLKILILTISVFWVVGLTAQNTLSNRYQRPESPAAYPYLSNNIINEARLPLYLPEIEGYTLLKCDFHMHTIFSDGSVWPTTRVEEAFREGLDAISITEHFEFRNINRKDVNTDNLMREYEIAGKKANELGIILIPGLEITREVPTGHLNMLFINDPSPLVQFVNKDNPRDPSNIEEILTAGKKLGAFIFWNHPAYQAPNGAEWTPIQQSLYEKGLIMGIEIINSSMYVPVVHQWADEKGLTKMANSDQHGSFRIRDGYHRAMTIVFAKNRSVEAIKEALIKKQTVGYAYNHLYGEQKLLNPVFQKSLIVKRLSSSEKDIIVEIRNTSGIPYELEFEEDLLLSPDKINNKGITLYANETVAIKMNKKNKMEPSEIHVAVRNLHVEAEKHLHTILSF